MQKTPRELIGETLTGDVLEIGPGFVPFPTAPGARVKFADRKVPGGRDANWPELAGFPDGVQGDFDVDLNTEGLGPVADASYDALIASHVIEHLVDPIRALREFWRVLKPGGKLALIVPDRRKTFDAPRQPTTFAHLLDEHRAGVTELSEEHIREYCAAIYGQPPMHPEQVRQWHNPATLDAERVELHRRRSIHTHCWNPEEFAAQIVGMLAHGLGAWRLRFVYSLDGRSVENEFGFVLLRQPANASGPALARRFVRDWVLAVLAAPTLDIARVLRFQQLCETAVAGVLPAGDVAEVVSKAITMRLACDCGADASPVSAQAEKDRTLSIILASRYWRMTDPLRKFCKIFKIKDSLRKI